MNPRIPPELLDPLVKLGLVHWLMLENPRTMAHEWRVTMATWSFKVTIEPVEISEVLRFPFSYGHRKSDTELDAFNQEFRRALVRICEREIRKRAAGAPLFDLTDSQAFATAELLLSGK